MKRSISYIALAALLSGIASPGLAGEFKSQAKTPKFMKMKMKEVFVSGVQPSGATEPAAQNSPYLQFELKGAAISKYRYGGASAKDSTLKGQIAGSPKKQKQGTTTSTDDWEENQ